MVGQDWELDLLLVFYDIAGLLVYGKMFSEVGLLLFDEYEQMVIVLCELYVQVEAGEFRIEVGVEDVYF